MPNKNRKRIKKKEELPSFLLNLSNHVLERKPYFPPKKLYTSPIFFGQNKQFHTIPRPIVLGGPHSQNYTAPSDDSLHSKLFLSEQELIQIPPEPAKNRPRKKRLKEFIDPYIHRCPGVRRAFIHDVKVVIPDFGETTSEIEAETWQEIPFCRVNNSIFESSETEVENFTLSDLKEKKRLLLPYEQRMAHNHFPKEFVTVKLIGPVIPASITITKIPSKRKRLSDFVFEVEKDITEIKPVAKNFEREEFEESYGIEEQMEDNEEEKEEETKAEEEKEEETKAEEEKGEEETKAEEEKEEEEMKAEEEKEEEETKAEEEFIEEGGELDENLEETELDEELENEEARTTLSEMIAEKEEEEEEEDEEAMIGDKGENIEDDKENNK